MSSDACMVVLKHLVQAMTKEGENHQLSLEHLLRRRRSELQPSSNAEHRANREVMFDLLGDLAPTVRTIFERMEIAEEEIQRAQVIYPHKADRIWDSFTYLRPSPILIPHTSHLYRAHVRELITRVALADGDLRKKELEAATDAELCCVFCAVSQALPLQSDAVAAYQRVFKKVFPEVSFLDEFANSESYPGRADEIVTKLRRKHRQKRD